MSVEFIGLGFLFLSNAYTVKAQQTAPITVFLTLTNGVLGTPYTLTLQDNTGISKDIISVTPSGGLTNLNYFPPPGVVIATGINGDKFCHSPTTTNNCVRLLNPPDSYGTTSLIIDLR